MLELLRRTKPELPVKQAITFDHLEIPSAEYQRVADKLGYTPAVVAKNKTKRTYLELLDELGLSMFSYKKVVRYLDSIHGGDWRRAKWGWRNVTDHSEAYTPNRNGQRLSGPYQRPIPYPVLCTMEQIKDRFSYPNHAPRFVISDTVREADFKDPDPFLGCIWDFDIVIIERWDEPSFRME